MSKPPFTPGPWFLINDWCVGGPIEPEWQEAGCGIAHCGMRARTPEEARSNACLIAAAPELYDALSAAISNLEHVSVYHEADDDDQDAIEARAAWDRDLTKFRAALAKARGAAE